MTQLVQNNNKSKSFAKPYQSLNDYNFLNWGSYITMAQDVAKKIIPNYEECDHEIKKMVAAAANTVLTELAKEKRIVITDREKKEHEVAEHRQISRDRELEELTKKYGSIKVARVIIANVYTHYLNAVGKSDSDYEIAKAWCIEQGIFAGIEYRGIHGLPAIGRAKVSEE